jgi:hypothetical protein
MVLVKEEETRKCIVSFKNGKAADEHGITIEHLKYGGQPIVQQVTKLVNCIFENHYLPSNLKSGISYPEHKNGVIPCSGADPGFQVRGGILEKNCAERREARKFWGYFV